MNIEIPEYLLIMNVNKMIREKGFKDNVIKGSVKIYLKSG